jgi:hypothetical protein
LGSTFASSTSGGTGPAAPPASQSEKGASSAVDRREVGVGELGEVDRVSLRAEVVHLGAVRGVVVDHDQQRQTETHGGLELGERHHRAAVAERGDAEPVGPRHGGADRRAEAEAHRLERIREDEAALVGNRQVLGGEAEEVPGVRRDRALGGEQVVERDRQRARVDELRGAGVLVRLVAPAPPRDQAPDLRGARVRAPPAASGERPCERPRRLGRVGGDPDIAAMEPPRRVRVDVDLHHLRADRDQVAVPRRPVVQPGAEGDDQIRPADQLDPERRREPAHDPERVREAREEAVRHRARRQQRAREVAQLLDRGACAR